MRNNVLISFVTFLISVVTVIPACSVRGLSKGHHSSQPAAKGESISFFVIGDWGEKASEGQQAVAAAMQTQSETFPPGFIVTTGDNFYDQGVASTADSQWASTFENIYRLPGIKWYPVLGNHDYILSPQAQVDYSRQSKRWEMPSKYYSKGFATRDDSLLILFIDTEPIERELRGKPIDESRIAKEFTTRQMEWMDEVLRTSKAKWKMVVGHHPMHTGGARRHSSRTRKMRQYLSGLFEKHKVDIYWSGHEHQLEYIKPGGNTHHIISGAGSHTSHLGYLKAHRKFAARQRGFVECTVSGAAVEFRFINSNNKILYSGIIQK